MTYNPNPTRVWSRVQDGCTYIDNGSYENVYVPLTRTTVPLSVANYQAQVIAKGNILQHKKNSSQLTKKQKYAQICKGLWTNRTKSYATQTQTYTNPNTSNLLRVNYNNVVSPDTSYINGPYNYNIPYPNGCISDTIKDGGALLCNTVANPCTDEVIEVNKTLQLQCYPTTCSDVPGPEQLLCWDSRLDTWYPRQRYNMSTSGTGWPEGYKGFVSALKPTVPILTLVSVTNISITLSWTITYDKCMPISSYNIYLNGQIYTNVPYTTTSITIEDGLFVINEFYVTSLSDQIESLPSNTINIPFTPTTFHKPVGSITNFEETILLEWSIEENPYYPIHNFNIYLNDAYYTTVNNNTRSIHIPKKILGETTNVTIKAISGIRMSASVPINYIKLAACSCSFFNKVQDNSVVSNIATLLNTSNAKLLDLSDNTYDISLNVYTTFKVELETFKRTLDSSCCLIKVIDLYQNILTNLYQSSSQKQQYLGQQTVTQIYKDAYDILQDKDKLQEYINTHFKQINIIEMDTSCPVITLKPHYAIYMHLYGLPDYLNFDPVLLTNVVNAIDEYNNTFGIPENTEYDLAKIREFIPF
jgi:hypothetical protein